MKARAIAFYLPQYYPIPENDEFWGKGFTEWTNVAKAKPLFNGHYQPFLPSDLGFYDLRVPEVRRQQAQLAKEAGIEGFCYWHYWFGDGKRALEKIFHEVQVSGDPDYPFCLGWANQDWTGKWHGLDNKIIFKQTYPGIVDIEKHFYHLLPSFKDKRYIRVDNKPLFIIYRHLDLPASYPLLATWNKLAAKEGLDGIFFVGNQGTRVSMEHPFDGYAPNGVYEAIVAIKNGDSKHSSIKRYLGSRLLSRIKGWNFRRQDISMVPLILEYAKYVDLLPLYAADNFFPTILPGWDNTPRLNKRGVVFKNESPKLFGELLMRTIDSLSSRKLEHRILFIKSWNEWAEGNVLEPSQKWGNAYLEELKSKLFDECRAIDSVYNH